MTFMEKLSSSAMLLLSWVTRLNAYAELALAPYTQVTDALGQWRFLLVFRGYSAAAEWT